MTRKQWSGYRRPGRLESAERFLIQLGVGCNEGGRQLRRPPYSTAEKSRGLFQEWLFQESGRVNRCAISGT